MTDKPLRRRPIPSQVKGPEWTGDETPAPFDDPRVVAARKFWQSLRDADRVGKEQDNTSTENETNG